jgi:hypothetical protein
VAFYYPHVNRLIRSISPLQEPAILMVGVIVLAFTWYTPYGPQGPASITRCFWSIIMDTGVGLGFLFLLSICLAYPLAICRIYATTS